VYATGGGLPMSISDDVSWAAGRLRHAGRARRQTGPDVIARGGNNSVGAAI